MELKAYKNFMLELLHMMLLCMRVVWIVIDLRVGWY